MKLGFVTCVQLGLSCMEAIYEAGGKLDLAISLPDNRAVNKSGRVYLDEFCGRHGIPLLKSSHVNDCEVIEAIKSAKLDWLFIIGWSQIANSELLGMPKKGVLGIHPTLLPLGRGRAAIPWAILKRLPRTGVTLFKLNERVDAGPIAGQLEIPLSGWTTATDLYREVELAHVTLLKDVMPKLLDGTLSLVEQDDDKATEWPGRTQEDGRIDTSGSVIEAECLVRAVTRPYPGAFIERDQKKLVVWSAEIHKEKPDDLFIGFPDGFLKCLDWTIEDA